MTARNTFEPELLGEALHRVRRRLDAMRSNASDALRRAQRTL